MTRPMPVYEIGQRNRLLQTLAVNGLGQARPTARAGISDIHGGRFYFPKAAICSSVRSA